ncbi:MAG: VWA domain-containing protein [Rhodospirillaceae bacterium]|nr:MAG: VWA domain-containing protein [Rhodospirillaceae bacterium]
MSLTILGLLLAGLLFWLAPLLRRGLDRLSGVSRNQRTSVLVLSLILRGLVVGLMAVLWLGLTQFRQTVPLQTKARIDVLLDVSESLVQADAPGVGDYLARADSLTDEIVQGLGVDADVYKRVFAEGSQALDRFANGVDTVRSLRGAATDLSAIIAETLAAGAGSPAQVILLMTDGLSTRQGAEDSDQITQVLQLLAGGEVPVLVVPQNGDPAFRLDRPDSPRFIIGEPQNLSLLRQGDLANRLVALPVDLAIKSQPEQRVAYLGALQGDAVQDLFRFTCLDGDPAGTAAIILAEGVDTVSCSPLVLEQEAEGAFVQMTLVLDEDPEPVPQARFAKPALPDNLQSRIVPAMAIPRVLWLDGGQQPIALIDTVMEELNWDLERVTPDDLPRRTGVDASEPLDFFDFDLIIMTDIAPGQIGNGLSQQVLLGEIEDFVQRGGGLFIAGGDETFGVKGLAATPIARVLPVNVDPKGSSGDPKILAVGVLDVSASLFYKPETLDRAVSYIVESFAPLSEGSLVRVFGFSDEVHELVPLDTYEGVEALEAQLRDALGLLGEEFERRRQLGLQPEGLAMYNALAETRRSLIMAQEAGLDLPDERRVLIVSDGADPDLGAYLSWKVDEDGVFQRDTAPSLASRLNSEDDFIINGIAMAYGEGSLPDAYTVLNSRDATLRQRFGIASEGFNSLFNVAQAGGGYAYLDQFTIPIGQLARRMTTYKDEQIEDPNFNQRHRFFDGLPVQDYGVGAINGYSILSARDGARFILGQPGYQPDEGRPLDLALWTDWVLTRSPQSTAEGLIERAALGGRVSVLGTSLRDGGAEGSLSDNAIFQVALARAFAWATRTDPRDAVGLELTRDDRNHVLLSLDHQSIDPFAPTAFVAEIFSLNTENAEPEAEAEAEAEAEGADGAESQTTRVSNDGPGTSTSAAQQSEPLARFELTGAERQWLGDFGPIRDLPEAFVLRITGQGTDRQGRARSFEKSGVIRPALLHRQTEPLALDRGADMASLRALALASGGSVLDANNLVVPQGLVQLDQTGTRERVWDLTWALVVLMLMALIADYLIREYLAEAEA